MGMEQVVSFASGAVPSWPGVRSVLAGVGFPVLMRMMDGQLTMPDAEPPEAWRELRVGTPQGMVSVRREPGRVLTVVWGNADAAMLQAWNAVTWAFAETGGGQVETPAGPVTATDYWARADLPPTVRSIK